MSLPRAVLAPLAVLLCVCAPAAVAHEEAPPGDAEAPPSDTCPEEAPGDDEAGGKEEEEEWDVATADLGPTDTIAFDVEEGTWMAVDVSPDGQWLVFDLLGDLYRMPIAGGEARLLRGGRAFEHQPRFSPDGQQVAFTSDAGGGDNLWVCKADGTEGRAITKEDYRLLNSPAWEPTGRAVAGRKHYTSRRSAGAGEIWLYDARRGGVGVQMVEKPTDQKDLGEPVFSADGRYLYYSLDVTPGKSFEYNKDPNQGIYAIRRLDLVTGETTTVAGGAGGSVRPQPSPDGRSLAFVRRIRGSTALMLLDLDTGVTRVLRDDLSQDQQETWAIFGVYPGFAWTPDGRSIVLWAQGRLSRLEVATGAVSPIPFRVHVEQVVTRAVRFAPEIGGDHFPVKAIRWPRVSPDGKQVVFQALGHLWIRPVAGGEPRRLNRGDELELYPAWSPDGGRIVYTTWSDAAGGQVRSITPAGKKPMIHTDRPGHYAWPSFSPDGRTIVYQRGGGDGIRGPSFGTDPGIYTVDAKGGIPALLTPEGEVPRWTGDGARIALFEGGEEKTLYTVDRLGGHRRDVATSERALEMSLSPDGRWVAFQQQWRVYVAPRPLTGGPIPVGPRMKAMPVVELSALGGEYLDWSPDSRELRFSLGPTLSRVEVAPLFEGEKAGEVDRREVELGWSAAADVPATDLVLVGATILTMGEAGVIEDGAVRIKGNRIVAVGPRAAVDTAGATVIDARGKVIMPGLIDVHAHVGGPSLETQPQANWAYLANLAFGVTTAHDPSNDTETIFSSAELVRAGLTLGPRIFSTGTILYGADGEVQALADSMEEARRHLGRQKAWGAFSVKSYNQPRRDQRQRIIKAARELEMMVVPEGGSTLSHNLSEILDGHTTIEHALPVAPLYEDVLTLFARSRTAYTPTLNVAYGGLFGENWWFQHTNVWEDERLLRFVPRERVDPVARRGIRAPDEDFHHIEVARAAAEIRRRGGIVELGAHGQMQGLGAHWELWSFGQGGMSPLEALEVATLGGAQALGLDGQLGSLEEGKLADLLVLDADPRADLRNSEDIALVMINGRLLDARTLEELAPTRRPAPVLPRQDP